MACEIKEYAHSPQIPKPLPPYNASYVEGLPTEWIASKLEETDLGYEHYDDYTDKVEDDVDAYMRSAVTDRNIDLPFTEDDIPSYNATKNSGALNARYNEGRGTTDYQPHHPELFMGDLQASKETLDIQMSKLKRHTAARADMAQVRMGNDTDFQVWEQAWAQPDISYALKDMQRWVANNLDWWEWPSFINPSFASAEGIIRDDKTRKNRADCAWKDYGDTIDTDMQFYDSNGKVKKQNIGYNVRPGDEQDHQGVKFQENFMGKVQSSKGQTDTTQANYAVKAGNADLVDRTNQNKHFKGQLAHEMKSAAREQIQAQDMHNSTSAVTRKGELMHDPRSTIKDIVKTQKERFETMAIGRQGVHQSADYGKHHRNTEGTLPWFLETNKVNMIKASRGEMDASKAQRNITQSYLLSQEVSNRMKAGSCLKDNHDRQAIMRDIQQQHQTGCENYGMCRPDSMAGHGMEHARKEYSDPSQKFGDDYHTKVMSSQKHPEQIKSRTLTADFDDNTFTDFSNREAWNSWH